MTAIATAPPFPPGPSRREALRMLRIMATDRLGMMTSAASTYGDAVRLPVGPKQLFLFNHPDHAKHVLTDNNANYHKGIGLVHARRALGDGLLTSEGELWRKQRKVVQPAFQPKRIDQQVDAISAEAARLVESLRGRIGGPPVDVVHEFTGLTLGVLGRTLLDTGLGAFDSVGPAFQAVQDQAIFELTTLGAVPPWVPTPSQVRFRRARRHLQRMVDELVAERNRTGTDGRGDVLSRLIVSASAETDPRVGRRRLRDELVTLLLAGHETTASTLGWTFYLIDRHPEVAQRLGEEARAVLGDRLPVLDDLNRLTYTSAVIEEVMRLYPAVWLLPRKAVADDVVGGYRVPAGSDVVICPYVLHRHPDFWDRPEQFDPERFTAGTPSGRPRYAYIPFGAGPRVCIGSHLGLMEAAIVVALVCRDLRLSVPPGRQVVPEPMLSLRVRGGLPMSVRAAE